MVFWSGPTLKARGKSLVEPFHPDSIDGAAYTLRLGHEYYVTPNDKASNPQTVTLARLASDEALPIPPGQFAYLMTDEIVRVPTNSLALISIRAGVKWKGLVNVSGFHVDPGFWGRLTYAVFNASPATIHLRQGDPIFLIWFSDLDGDAGEYAKTPKAPITKMDVSILNHVAGELHSLDGLATKLRETERELHDKIVAVEKHTHRMEILAGMLGVALLGVLLRWLLAAPETPQVPMVLTQPPAITAPTPLPPMTPQLVPSPLPDRPKQVAPLKSPPDAPANAAG
ncbi:dCTP deaminase domain-containing protein [Sphingobium boeckii]|uniref:dCTP deaminase n=1 Tax=Sphingobium boeckii TaxID=1082345 RepID=A0A7W9ALP4_9SPHN|nr:deoxycytidine triphosphate deaminase [Sphingobium boeckii]MBB5687838.1 dCTP deaminase [Sphingobium boeckii]